MTDCPEQWRIEVNDRYREIVDILIGLASAALILPAIFLRTFLGIEETDPVLKYLDWRAFSSLAAFGLVVAIGLVFHYTSVKWVKATWGQPLKVSNKTLETTLDWCFWLAVIAFGAGILLFLWFTMIFETSMK